MNYVLDASVYVARHSPNETHHERAKELWKFAVAAPFHVPEIFSLEVVAAFSRLKSSVEVVAGHHAFTTGVKFIVHPVDRSLIEEATQVAKDARTRAADSIYMALAQRLGATFLTLDFKLKSHLSASLSASLREMMIES